MKPEAAEKLEMKEQEERDNARLQDEKRLSKNEEKGSNGYWHYIPDCDDYMWVGRLVVGSGPAHDCSNDLDGMCENPYNITEEQLEEQKKEDKEYHESFL